MVSVSPGQGFLNYIRKLVQGARVIGQWLKALVAVVEDLDSVLRIHISAQSPGTPIPGDSMPSFDLQTSMYTHTCVHRYACKQNNHTHTTEVIKKVS